LTATRGLTGTVPVGLTVGADAVAVPGEAATQMIWHKAPNTAMSKRFRNARARFSDARFNTRCCLEHKGATQGKFIKGPRLRVTACVRSAIWFLESWRRNSSEVTARSVTRSACECGTSLAEHLRYLKIPFGIFREKCCHTGPVTTRSQQGGHNRHNQVTDRHTPSGLRLRSLTTIVLRGERENGAVFKPAVSFLEEPASHCGEK
jgi:hypothetical protein